MLSGDEKEFMFSFHFEKQKWINNRYNAFKETDIELIYIEIGKKIGLYKFHQSRSDQIYLNFEIAHLNG